MKTSVLLISFLTITHLLFSQNNPNQSRDTIIIYKDPFIIKKSVYIQKKKKKEKNKAKVFFYSNIYFSPLITANYYSVCPGCEDYFSKYKAATKSKIGFSTGANTCFEYKKLFFSAGVGYTSFREKFNYSVIDNSLPIFITNSYNYLDLASSLGYCIKKNQFVVIPNLGIMFSKLLSINGFTISEKDLSKAYEISDVRNYNNWNIAGLVGMKVFYIISNRFHLFGEPLYIGELRSTVTIRQPFTQQRNSISLRIGVGLHF